MCRATAQPNSWLARSIVHWSTARPNFAAGIPKRSGGARHAEIACECELRACPHRRSVDCGKRDARQRRETTQCCTERIRKVVALDTRQVGTRTERGWLARQHDHPCRALDRALV